MSLSGPILLLFLLAQGPSSGTATSDAKARAQAQMKLGVRAFQQAEFHEALSRFQRAYGIFPSPKLLLNIGQAHQELGHPLPAIEAFEQFLDKAPDAPEHAIRAAQRGLENLFPKVGQILIDCPTTGAEVSLDAKPIGFSPIHKPIRVLPGRHTLSATTAGGATVTKDMDVQAGQTGTVVLRPKPVAKPLASRQFPARPEKALSTSRPAPAPLATHPGWFANRSWTWVAAGSAVVFAGGAATAGIMMRSKYQSLDQTCGQSSGQDYLGCSRADLAALDRWKNTANVLWGLTAAATVTAGVLFYVEGQSVELTPTAGSVIGMNARMRY